MIISRNLTLISDDLPINRGPLANAAEYLVIYVYQKSFNVRDIISVPIINAMGYVVADIITKGRISQILDEHPTLRQVSFIRPLTTLIPTIVSVLFEWPKENGGLKWTAWDVSPKLITFIIYMPTFFLAPKLALSARIIAYPTVALAIWGDNLQICDKGVKVCMQDRLLSEESCEHIVDTACQSDKLKILSHVVTSGFLSTTAVGLLNTPMNALASLSKEIITPCGDKIAELVGKFAGLFLVHYLPELTGVLWAGFVKSPQDAYKEASIIYLTPEKINSVALFGFSNAVCSIKFNVLFCTTFTLVTEKIENEVVDIKTDQILPELITTTLLIKSCIAGLSLTVVPVPIAVGTCSLLSGAIANHVNDFIKDVVDNNPVLQKSLDTANDFAYQVSVCAMATVLGGPIIGLSTCAVLVGAQFVE